MVFLHISNQPEIPLMTILKSFVYAFVSFLKKEVIITSLCNTNIVVFDLYMIISQREEKRKKWIGESRTILLHT